MNATLETIYSDFDTRLKSFTLRRVSDPNAAEDVLQEVYLKIHSHIQDVRDTERLESWIYRIARNAITDYYRRTRPQDELSESVAAPALDEPDAVSELAPSVRDMLRCLPSKYRRPLEMTELEGLTQVEVAGRLQISVSAAKSRVQRAREKLKAAFLDCCHFEFDRLGNVISFQARCPECAGDHAYDNCEGDADDEG